MWHWKDPISTCSTCCMQINSRPSLCIGPGHYCWVSLFFSSLCEAESPWKMTSTFPEGFRLGSESSQIERHSEMRGGGGILSVYVPCFTLCFDSCSQTGSFFLEGRNVRYLRPKWLSRAQYGLACYVCDKVQVQGPTLVLFAFRR